MINRQHTIQAAVIWLTGLPASGKTSIANCLAALYRLHYINPIVLDGDEIRQVMAITGFDEAARRQHNLHVGRLAALLEQQGHVVIVSLISPYAAVRAEIRQLCSHFIEVHVATALKICMQRDPKGLYKKALTGDIKDFTGISAPYEAPERAALTIDTVGRTPEHCAREIFTFHLPSAPADSGTVAQMQENVNPLSTR